MDANNKKWSASELDSNIKEMIKNGASNEDIVAYSNDYNNQHIFEEHPQPKVEFAQAALQPQKNLAQYIQQEGITPQPLEQRKIDVSGFELKPQMVNPLNPTQEEVAAATKLEAEKKYKALQEKKFKAQYDIAKTEIESSLATDKDLYHAGRDLEQKVNDKTATPSEISLYEEIKPKYDLQKKEVEDKYVHWGLTKISKNPDEPKIYDLSTKYLNAIHSNDPAEKSKAFDYLSSIKKINPEWQPNELALNPIENEKLKNIYNSSVINYKRAENEYNNAKAKLGGTAAQLAANIPFANINQMPEAAKFKEKEEELRQASIQLNAAYKSYVLKEDVAAEQKEQTKDIQFSPQLDPTLNLLKGFGNWTSTELNTLASKIKGVQESENKIAEPTYTTQPSIEQSEALKSAYQGQGMEVPKGLAETETPFSTEVGRATGGLTYMMGQTLPIAPLVELGVSGVLGTEASALSQQLLKSNRFIDKVKGAALKSAQEGITFGASTGNPEDVGMGVEFGLAGSLGEVLPKIISETPYLNKLAGAGTTVSALEAKKYAQAAVDYIATDDTFDKALENNGVNPNMPLEAKKALVDFIMFSSGALVHGGGGNKAEAIKEYDRLKDNFSKYSDIWTKNGMKDDVKESIKESIEEQKPTTEQATQPTETPKAEEVKTEVTPTETITEIQPIDVSETPTAEQHLSGDVEKKVVEIPNEEPITEEEVRINEPINEGAIIELPKIEVVNKFTEQEPITDEKIDNAIAENENHIAELPNLKINENAGEIINAAEKETSNPPTNEAEAIQKLNTINNALEAATSVQGGETTAASESGTAEGETIANKQTEGGEPKTTEAAIKETPKELSSVEETAKAFEGVDANTLLEDIKQKAIEADYDNTGKFVKSVPTGRKDRFMNNVNQFEATNPFTNEKKLFKKKYEAQQYITDEISKSVTTNGRRKILSEAYHKAKADGSNPELVKAVEDLITTKNKENATKEIEQQTSVPSEPKSGVESKQTDKTSVGGGLQRTTEGEKEVNTERVNDAKKMSLASYKAKYKDATNDEYFGNRTSGITKSSIPDKLREFADKNDEAAKGQVNVSILGLDSKTASKVIRKVADLIEKGIEIKEAIKAAFNEFKIAHDEEKVNEFEKGIRKHVYSTYERLKQGENIEEILTDIETDKKAEIEARLRKANPNATDEQIAKAVEKSWELTKTKERNNAKNLKIVDPIAFSSDPNKKDVKAIADHITKIAKESVKEGIAKQKDFAKNFAEKVKEILKDPQWKGKLSDKQVKGLLDKAINATTEKRVAKFVEYANKVLADKVYADKLANAEDLLSKVKQKISSFKNIPLTTRQLLVSLKELSPSEIDDIDTYTQILSSFNDELSGKKGGRTFTTNEITDFISKELANKQDLETKRMTDEFNSLKDELSKEGVDVSGLTLDDYKQMLTEQAGYEKEGELYKAAKDKLITKVRNRLPELKKSVEDARVLQNKITPETETEKRILDNVLDMLSKEETDLSQLTDLKTLKEVENALNNYIENGDLSGLSDIAIDNEANTITKKLKDWSIRMRQLKTDKATRFYRSNINKASIPGIFARLTYSDADAAKFQQETKIRPVNDAADKAIEFRDKFANEVSKIAKEYKLDQWNEYRMGVFSTLAQHDNFKNIDGTPVTFEQMKKHLLDTSNKLLDQANNTAQKGSLDTKTEDYKEWATAIKGILENINDFGGATDIKEVWDKLNDGERKIIDKQYDYSNKTGSKTAETALLVDNKVMPLLNNYSPLNALKLGGQNVESDIDLTSNDINRNFINKKPIGSTIERQPLTPNTFYRPDYYNTIFSNVFENEFYNSSQLDLKILSKIINSKDFAEIVNAAPVDETNIDPITKEPRGKILNNENLLREKIVGNIETIKKIGSTEKERVKAFKSILNIVGKGVKVVIEHPLAIATQALPNVMQTVRENGRKSVWEAFKSYKEDSDSFYKLLNETAYKAAAPDSNEFLRENTIQDKLSQARRGNVSSATKVATKIAKGAGDIYYGVSDFFNDNKVANLIKKSTIDMGHTMFTAGDKTGKATAYISSYIKYLLDEGIIKDVSEFDIKKEAENPNPYALAFADQRATAITGNARRQQKASILRGKEDQTWVDDGKYFLQEFSLNAYERAANSYHILIDKNSTKKEKDQAINRMVGYLVAGATFAAATQLSKYAYQRGTDELLDSIFDLETDDKAVTEEGKKALVRGAAKFVNDAALGGQMSYTQGVSQAAVDWGWNESFNAFLTKKERQKGTYKSPNFVPYYLGEGVPLGKYTLPSELLVQPFEHISKNQSESKRNYEKRKAAGRFGYALEWLGLLTGSGLLYKAGASMNVTSKKPDRFK